MSLCPHCEEELEFKITLKTTPINEKDLMDYIETITDKQKKKMALWSLKYTLKFLKDVDSLPLLCFGCRNCGKVINTEIASNIETPFNRR